ncbi:MAG: nucleotidyltransferase family protein [Burkholderiaceae bacterium]
MEALPKLEISPRHWDIVKGILQKHLPHTTVWAFGSRARFAAKPYSDLDLAIVGEHPLSLSEMAALEHEFTESALPFKVDVVDWAGTSTAFQNIIKQSHVAVWPPPR